ncbi:pyridoxal 5'-phosphate synthase glutaminase subunit PdxT [uncultured Methanobrevibacter sp.]|uniref:pyridoxal 5'-phosphate synthase glutaminase subunit PdxT n=1 Tax=uncultured Methanobrevibacter sp. TaxID=253161 RepID=UPI0025DAB7D0|nr:pyridoxal 5'-phosphate synthase glutaminase subunit PdxT [uncultured Methanobrevibacter sp.]MCI6994373.1 pyridoxal 5'-phosphate synthase glutaminase subunit PdxT [Methanobrevibacter sp.]
MVKIGILNLQGAVSEHYDITQKAVKNMGVDVEVESVRYAEDVETCDGLIISGGESTVIGKLIHQRGIDEVIKNNDIAVFGTCAGMVLLGKKTDFDQPLIGLMDISVKRNTYGRQKDSFESPIEIFGKEYLGVFIRAPALDDYDHSKEDIKVLSVLDDEIIAIQQGPHLAISFHPELTEDTLVHEYFIRGVIGRN